MKLWTLLVVLILIAVLNYCTTAHAKVYAIPAGDASETLNEWSRQSGLQIGFNYYVIRGLKTNRVYGDIDALEALEDMLRDTGWISDPVNDRMIVVIPGLKPLETCKPWLGAKAPLPPCKQAT